MNGPMMPGDQAAGTAPSPTTPTADPTAPPIAGLRPGAKPPAYDNPARQIEVFKEVLKQATEGRTVFERGWWRILMYLLLRQWIYYDTKRGQWRDKRLAKWMPRPTNTKMNEAQQTLRSIFASIDLGAIVRPNGNSPINVTTADTADKLEPLIKEEHAFDAVIRDADFWLTALGNVVLHSWWDAEGGGTVMVPVGACADCGMTHPAGTVDFTAPECQGCQSDQVHPIPGTDQPIKQGRGRTDVCSPLEILVPDGYQQWEDVRELIRPRWRTKSYYEANYPDLVDQIVWQKAPQERSIQLLKALSSQSDLTATPFMSGGGGDQGSSEGIVEYEMWLKPTEEFPQGYVGRFVGEGEPIIIEDEGQSLPGPIPYTDIHGEPMWHWVHMGYDTFGGRLWSRGPLEALVPLVDKLNRLDARIELIVDRMSNPIWLEPKGAEVERLTGEPGIIVRYHALGTNGVGKPERVEGSNIPASLFNLRAQYLSDIEEAVGTHDVLKGERPPNVEAFSAIQALIEQGQKRFTSVFKERGRGYRDWFKIALEMERQWGPPERVKAAMGPNETWGFEIYKKADLQGAVSIVVEDGSTVPKTALGERASIDHANQLGLLNPANPDQNFAVMAKLGLKALVPHVDKSVSAALREQHLYEEWVASGRQGPIPLLRIDYVDDDVIHVAQHRMWATSDAMHDLMLSDPQAMQEIQMHIYQHENGAFQRAAAMQAATPGKGPHTPGAAGAGQAMTNSNRESGNPADAGIMPRAA